MRYQIYVSQCLLWFPEKVENNQKHNRPRCLQELYCHEADEMLKRKTEKKAFRRTELQMRVLERLLFMKAIRAFISAAH